MEKIFTEIFTAFKEKISSPFFRYFTISWFLWNYKFVYFISFLDEKVYFEAHKITKFDYLMNSNFFYGTWYCSLGFFLIFPIISALFFIYVFPYINIYFLKEYDRNTKKEDKIKYDYKKFIKEKDIELTKLELKEKVEETKLVNQEVKKTKAVKEKKTLEVNKIDEYKKEYNEFKISQAYNVFNYVIEIVNFHDGYFLSNNVNYRVQNNTISYLLANKIIIKSTKDSRYHQFTEKGEYFTKWYFEENNK